MADEERLRRATQAVEARHQARPDRDDEREALARQNADTYRRFVQELARTGETDVERTLLRSSSFRA